MKNEVDIATISPWLEVLWDKQGSDLLLATGSEPRIRVDGKLSAIENTDALSGDQIEAIVRGMLSPENKKTFDEHQDVDFSLSWLDGLASAAVRSPRRGIPRWHSA